MKVFFATGNPGKVKHASRLLNHQVEQLETDLTEPSEDLKKIARAKVRQASTEVGDDAAVIAEDSGLFVNDLNGFPGPHTGFFDEKVGKEKLLDLVEDDRSAEFRAAVALRKGEASKVFTGKVPGRIVEPRGDAGFGYDPMFRPEGADETWGENPELKDQESHREKAMKKLDSFLG